jgi:NAD(P)H dehydrogenase (quinone)
VNQNQPRIIITGASGGLGSEIAAQLLRIAPEALFAVSVRDPAKVSHLRQSGVQVRHGDFDLPATLDDAFRGADRLLVISTRGSNGDRIRQHRSALEAARRVGVAQVYYTSIVQREGSPFGPVSGHLATEDDARHSGIPYTIFRNGQYIENLPMFVGMGLDGNRLALPPDGPVAWVARADLAEGIARVMAEGGRAGETLLLTGPEALDFEDIANILSAQSGRPVGRQVISGEEFVRRLKERGVDAQLARMLETGFRSRAEGDLIEVDPTLEQIVRRPLETVADLLPRLLREARRHPEEADIGR